MLFQHSVFHSSQLGVAIFLVLNAVLNVKIYLNNSKQEVCTYDHSKCTKMYAFDFNEKSQATSLLNFNLIDLIHQRG